ncbi:hypothetical protein COW46_05515 [Candidatus Gracilibacteria bacterium CG17_big_fil_post_rev_8_21_14_2_50_48_13]|nr:MAG: hypothetical protein COW46_05515 [Candidatus Gracilibacteria bacterium CG17_big_fil_post_rev_8_21_14_2_50_48_13]
MHNFYKAALLVMLFALPTAHAASGIQNIYRLDTTVHIQQPVDGDVVAFAGDLIIDAPVSGDVLTTAGKVEIHAPIGGDVRALASRLLIGDAHVQGDIQYVGSEFILSPAASASGVLMVQSGQAIVQGQTGSGFTLEASDITFGGAHQGPVSLRSLSLQFLGGTTVNSLLSYASDQVRDASAVTAGTIEVLSQGINSLQEQGMMFLWSTLLSAFAALLLAILLRQCAPQFVTQVTQKLREKGTANIFWGVLFFFLFPGFMSLLMGGVLALYPLGLAFLPLVLVAALVYILLFLLAPGVFVLTLALHHMAETKSRWQRWTALPTASLVFGLAMNLPFVGTMLLFAILTYTAGAILRPQKA